MRVVKIVHQVLIPILGFVSKGYNTVFRPEGATLYQPSATRWVLDANKLN